MQQMWSVSDGNSIATIEGTHVKYVDIVSLVTFFDDNVRIAFAQRRGLKVINTIVITESMMQTILS